MDELLPKVAVDLSRPPAEQGIGTGELWIEIGFGGAEHLIWQAQHHRDVTLIGCEPFEEGVVKALTGIAEHDLSGVRLHADDARAVLRWLPEASVSPRFHSLSRSLAEEAASKRRLINADLMKLLARVIKPGGEFRFGTDIGDYARTALLAIMGSGAFQVEG